MLPVALVSTPAGAIADMFDRRIVGLVALSIALAGSISLSALAWLGVMTPALLLVSCFTIGSGMALFGPAWQASVSEQVPAEALPSAVAPRRRQSNRQPWLPYAGPRQEQRRHRFETLTLGVDRVAPTDETFDG
jgi:MFS family permease